jgi:hypothetical protein
LMVSLTSFMTSVDFDSVPDTRSMAAQQSSAATRPLTATCKRALHTHSMAAKLHSANPHTAAGLQVHQVPAQHSSLPNTDCMT